MKIAQLVTSVMPLNALNVSKAKIKWNKAFVLQKIARKCIRIVKHAQ